MLKHQCHRLIRTLRLQHVRDIDKRSHHPQIATIKATDMSLHPSNHHHLIIDIYLMLYPACIAKTGCRSSFLILSIRNYHVVSNFDFWTSCTSTCCALSLPGLRGSGDLCFLVSYFVFPRLSVEQSDRWWYPVFFFLFATWVRHLVSAHV